jgi:hypothetical protein
MSTADSVVSALFVTGLTTPLAVSMALGIPNVLDAGPPITKLNDLISHYQRAIALANVEWMKRRILGVEIALGHEAASTLSDNPLLIDLPSDYERPVSRVNAEWLRERVQSLDPLSDRVPVNLGDDVVENGHVYTASDTP